MADNTDITSLASRVPDESARYHVFTYKHTHEGDYTESIGEYLVINQVYAAHVHNYVQFISDK